VPNGAGEASLPVRLRGLRSGWPGLRVTQGHVAEALGTSVPLVSSWESQTNPALPSEERLQAYARFFATRRSLDGGTARLLSDDELTDDEEDVRRHLIDELVRLRDATLRADAESHPETGALGGRFFHFPDGQPVRIIAGALPVSELAGVQYAHPWHPNEIRSLWNADADATVELYAHIRAENPTADVEWKLAREMDADDLTGHVIVLGGGDGLLGVKSEPSGPASALLQFLAARLELPLASWSPPDGDKEYDMAFVLGLDPDGRPSYEVVKTLEPSQTAKDLSSLPVQVFRPRFLRGSEGGRRFRDVRGVEVFPMEGGPRGQAFRDAEGRITWLDEGGEERPYEGQPQIEYDVALIVRQPNPLNAEATVTFLCGLFSRGTFGAAMAFADPKLRTRNERWVQDNLDFDHFWLLTYVPVFPSSAGAQTVTPDLARPFHRLWTSTT